ncbi:MAG: hypothetical protein PW734_01015 [Verrucomicrobium sp.]|nr:hypothetical protein [Verrucomicrobium sp.]
MTSGTFASAQSRSTAQTGRANANSRNTNSNANGDADAPTQILSVQPNPASPNLAPAALTPTPPVSTVTVPSGQTGATRGLVPADVPMVDSPTLGDQMAPAPQPSPSSAPAPVPGEGGVLRLRLALHELILLQQAAHEAGGDIRISIDPVGITTEDLIVPLARDPEFLVKREGDVIIVSTRSPDAVAMQMRQEVQKLEDRRRALLQDISVLERLSNSKTPLPSQSQ